MLFGGLRGGLSTATSIASSSIASSMGEDAKANTFFDELKKLYELEDDLAKYFYDKPPKGI